MATLRATGAFLAWYVTAWLLAYLVVMGFEVRYVWQYFSLGWTFSGGEIPTFIWFLSLVVFSVGVAAYLALRHLRQREVAS
ncbi:MAG: hypothetical protein AMXMBFR36_26000 [Acidobacteriota bacterium]